MTHLLADMEEVEARQCVDGGKLSVLSVYSSNTGEPAAFQMASFPVLPEVHNRHNSVFFPGAFHHPQCR